MARIIKKNSKKPYNKSFLRRVRLFIDNIIFISKLLILIIIITIGFTLYFSGNFSKKVTDSLYNKLAYYPAFNLKLENVYLQGQNHVSKDEIIKNLELFITIGEPILNIPLNKIKAKLESLGWVEHAIIERRLPTTILINIVEKRPIAIWQPKGKLYLIDQKANIITTNKIKEFPHLMLIVGDEALLHLHPLLNILEQDKNFLNKIGLVTRISQRRWNIKLTNGLEVKLPEKGEKEAIEWLLNLEHKKKLNPEMKVIDLRIPGKIYIDGEIEQFEFEKNI